MRTAMRDADGEQAVVTPAYTVATAPAGFAGTASAAAGVRAVQGETAVACIDGRTCSQPAAVAYAAMTRVQRYTVRKALPPERLDQWRVTSTCQRRAADGYRETMLAFGQQFRHGRIGHTHLTAATPLLLDVDDQVAALRGRGKIVEYEGARGHG